MRNIQVLLILLASFFSTQLVIAGTEADDDRKMTPEELREGQGCFIPDAELFCSYRGTSNNVLSGTTIYWSDDNVNGIVLSAAVNSLHHAIIGTAPQSFEEADRALLTFLAHIEVYPLLNNLEALADHHVLSSNIEMFSVGFGMQMPPRTNIVGSPFVSVSVNAPIASHFAGSSGVIFELPITQGMLNDGQVFASSVNIQDGAELFYDLGNGLLEYSITELLILGGGHIRREFNVRPNSLELADLHQFGQIRNRQYLPKSLIKKSIRRPKDPDTYDSVEDDILKDFLGDPDSEGGGFNFGAGFAS